MQALGIWNEAFMPMVHDLCVLERELSRTRSQWKATAEDGKAPDALDPHYAVIRQQCRDIAALRDSLGLTPKALRRVKLSALGDTPAEDKPQASVLSIVREKFG